MGTAFWVLQPQEEAGGKAEFEVGAPVAALAEAGHGGQAVPADLAAGEGVVAGSAHSGLFHI